jgi:hypothetical protein
MLLIHWKSDNQQCLQIDRIETPDVFFHVGATFEMRTVLYRIRLLIAKVEMHDRVFISKQFMLGESKTAER